MLGSNAVGCAISETGISEDRKGHFVLVQVRAWKHSMILKRVDTGQSMGLAGA